MKASTCLFSVLFLVSILPAQQKKEAWSSASSVLSNSAVSTPTVVNDTLHYFYNKEYFKNPNAPISGLPYYKSAATTFTNITHFGSVFLNSDPNLSIYGLEGMLNASINGALTVPMTLYLYNVNAMLLPSTAIDSINIFVGSLPPNPQGIKYGGVFGTSLNPVSHVVPGNFAVLIRNKGNLTGDTVHVFRTSGITPTNAAAGNTNMPRGEGLGVIRWAGLFQKTTNFPHPQFGFGTDYEFCLAPMVTYTLQAGHIAPPEVNSVPTQTAYLMQPLTFTNISSPELTSRFFNLNVFYHRFQPFINQPPGGFTNDSALSWHFGDEDLNYPNLRTPLYLREGMSTVTKYYDTVGCFTTGNVRANLRRMKAGGSSVSYSAAIPFSVCIQDENVGLIQNTPLEPILLAENPVKNAILQVKGLKGANEFFIYNSLGVLCLREEQLDGLSGLNVSTLKKGSYYLRIQSREELRHYLPIKFIID
ncbi:MAG: T9SS type A sorting domain-containing protein [Bacteroidia bacterium]|nr:T9SS type A sorting domain-containing protein [Bacteroidia bacterium]